VPDARYQDYPSLDDLVAFLVCAVFALSAAVSGVCAVFFLQGRP
jgi:hypothetical protein